MERCYQEMQQATSEIPMDGNDYQQAKKMFVRGFAFRSNVRYLCKNETDSVVEYVQYGDRKEAYCRKSFSDGVVRYYWVCCGIKSEYHPLEHKSLA